MTRYTTPGSVTPSTCDRRLPLLYAACAPEVGVASLASGSIRPTRVPSLVVHDGMACDAKLPSPSGVPSSKSALFTVTGTYSGSHGDVGDAVGAPVVGDVVGTPVGDVVGVPVGAFVGADVGRFVGPGVGDGVGPGVGDGVGLGVGPGVGDGVGAGVGDGVGLGVGPGVGDGVGFGVGFGVGLGVGFGVGAGVGIAVGDGVGAAVVGFGVGAGVGIAVGDGVGDVVGGGAGTSKPKPNPHDRLVDCRRTLSNSVCWPFDLSTMLMAWPALASVELGTKSNEMVLVASGRIELAAPMCCALTLPPAVSSTV